MKKLIIAASILSAFTSIANAAVQVNPISNVVIRLNTETTERKAEDANIHHLLNSEAVSRVKHDQDLQKQIDNMQLKPGPKGDKGDQGAAGAAGKDGVDGKAGINGVDGKDGANGLNGKDGKDGKSADESRLKRIEKRNKELQDQVKRIGAAGVASANLHYNRTENGYAVAVGQYGSATAIAGGLQFNTSKDTAVTVQASYDGSDTGASVGFHGSW